MLPSIHFLASFSAIAATSLGTNLARVDFGARERVVLFSVSVEVALGREGALTYVRILAVYLCVPVLRCRQCEFVMSKWSLCGDSTSASATREIVLGDILALGSKMFFRQVKRDRNLADESMGTDAGTKLGWPDGLHREQLLLQ